MGEGGWFGDDSNALHFCAFYFYSDYTMIYNEIITQLIIMQNQWEALVSLILFKIQTYVYIYIQIIVMHISLPCCSPPAVWPDSGDWGPLF